MSKAGSTPISPNLIAGLMAFVVVVAVVASGPQILAGLGNKALDGLVVSPSMQKNMGTLVQGMGMANPAFLPVYGSSELTRLEPNRADQFFLESPTGFKVCPVGAAGNTTLLTAEKIAALGRKVHERKVVVLLSCSWFRRAGVPADHYAGNFSAAQAMNIMLDTTLDSGVRRRLAERILDFPDTLKDQSALTICARALLANDPLSALLGWAQRPILQLQRASMAVEDNLGTLFNAFVGPAAKNDRVKVASSQPFSWEKIISQASDFAPPIDPGEYAQPHRTGVADESFIGGFDNAKEWADFDLLLDTFKALHARPLIVAIPLNGRYESAHGVSLKARNYYYDRVNAACSQRGIPMAHFEDHDLDGEFVLNHSSHLSGKGWIFLDRLLDDFYHDRLSTAFGRVTKS